MVRNQRALAARLAFVVTSFALAVATPVHAAAPCEQRVLTDWSDNGRVDGVYPLRCYEGAIDALPVDLRDYTNAEQVIGRALTAALRTSPPLDATPRSTETSSTGDSGVPLPLAGGAGVAAVVLLAGAIAYLIRRRSLP